jgi:hypothetical protein
METIKVIEPRVNVKPDVEKNHAVLMGGLRYNEQVNVADSGKSQHQANPSTMEYLSSFDTNNC